MLKIRTKLILLVVAIALSGCGFKLKGSYDIPYQTIYLQPAGESRVGRIIKKKIKRKSSIDLVQTMSAAEVAINILSEASTRTVAVLSSAGSVDEYELVYSVRYTIESPNNSTSSV